MERLSASEYATALDLAARASRSRPESWHIMNTLGVAQYRVDIPLDAIATLERSIELEIIDRGNKIATPHPSNAAFLALCHHKTGNRGEADKYRAMFDDAMKDEKFSKDKDNLSFQKEVNAAFGDRE